jgi:hypothetical protein
MQVRYLQAVQKDEEGKSSKNTTHFIGIYDESTLNLLPLSVRELVSAG